MSGKEVHHPRHHHRHRHRRHHPQRVETQARRPQWEREERHADNERWVGSTHTRCQEPPEGEGWHSGG
jgi:hypothetical protein